MMCPTRCAKILLIIINSIFFLAGAALVAIGIWLRVDPSYFEKLVAVDIVSGKMFEIALYVVIAFGALVLIVSFCGCAGAAVESRCLLGFYIAFIVLVILGEIAAAVLAIIYRRELPGKIATELRDQLKKDEYATKDGANKITYTALGASMNLIQQDLKCCGINGPNDYDNKPGFANIFPLEYPFSCCSNIKGEKVAPEGIDGTCQKATVGCKVGLESFIDQNLMLIIGIVLAVICVEIFGLIFGICVCRMTTYDD